MTTPPDACDISGLIDWPDELGYTRITAHLFQAFADGCDEGEQPDMKAATGTLTLTYNTGAFKYTPTDSSQPTRMIGGRTITCTVLPDGTITNSGSGQTSDGSVIIMATDSERLEPRETTVTANFSLSQGPAIQPVTFVPRADTTVNLAELPDMAKSPGVIVEPVVTEDTAVRAEAAALRAEQAAAGVADIGAQVEQVQAYTTRAETAATSAETAATSAVAASAEAATVTTDAAYIRDVIAQHGTLKGDPGPAPVIEWQGDRLSVDGQLSPALTGAPGRDGGPVPVGGTAGQVVTRTGDGGVAWTDVAGGDGLNIVGPGRPDQPGTTGLLIDGSETVGTTYTSTDGAGVGAWVWRKRPTGWAVVDCDTGWRDVTSIVGAPPELTVWLRRIGYSVHMIASASAEASSEVVMASIPDGYKPSKPEGKPFIAAGPIGPIGRTKDHRGWIGFNEPHSEQVHSSAKILANNRAYGEWLTDQPPPNA